MEISNRKRFANALPGKNLFLYFNIKVFSRLKQILLLQARLSYGGDKINFQFSIINFQSIINYLIFNQMNYF